MRTEPPIILSAFANDPTRPLRLAEEERAIREALAFAHDQRRIELVHIGHASLTDVYRNFNRFHNRIAIFHYGGHSDQQFLNLEDVNSRAGSLSKLIGMQKGLQLVFLNGCGNKQHLTSLFDKGVKAVIATSTSINDQKAQQFAAQFYHALASGKSLATAFETAASFLGHEHPELDIQHRGIMLRQDTTDNLPWGLYAKDEADLDWALPPVTVIPDNLDFFQEVSLNIPDINRELILMTFTGMAEYGEEHKTLYNVYKQMPSGAMLNALQNTLLDAFPSILSNQIRDLFTPEGRMYGRVRLKEINEVYLTLIRMLSSIALSNLWDTALEMKKQRPEGLIIRKSYRKEFHDFLEMSPDQMEGFDYLWLVATVSRIMLDNEVKPYVKELIYLNQGFREADEFYDGYRFLETQVRQRLQAKNIASDEVEELCIHAEHHLGALLQKCAFLCSYQLVTIKDISVFSPRPSPEPIFIHAKSILRGRDYATIDRAPVQRQSFTSNNSVFITRNIQDEVPPLNLSPFILDENTFIHKEDYLPKIYYYFGKEGDKLHYQHAEVLRNQFILEPEYDRKKYRNLEIVFDQIDFFRKILRL